jgi:hypothetical protein
VQRHTLGAQSHSGTRFSSVCRCMVPELPTATVDVVGSLVPPPALHGGGGSWERQYTAEVQAEASQHVGGRPRLQEKPTQTFEQVFEDRNERSTTAKRARAAGTNRQYMAGADYEQTYGCDVLYHQLVTQCVSRVKRVLGSPFPLRVKMGARYR